MFAHHDAVLFQIEERLAQRRTRDAQLTRQLLLGWKLLACLVRATLDQVKAERQKRLFSLFEQEKPDLFLIELYPFGRKAFRFELDPILMALEEKILPGCPVICSVRDILVEKDDNGKHESRVVETLNRYFDAVLVHADPELVTIDETFDRFEEIKIPVDYTGYIAPELSPGAGRKIRDQLGIADDEILIVASAGGGNVGAPLLQAVMEAFYRLEAKNRCYLEIFSGPFLDQSEFELLKKKAGNNVQVERFTADFVSHLAAADLSVSMGGYNTTMDILAAKVPALVWPFSQNREQRLRAGRLADLGVIGVLENEELQPDRLAGIMDQWIAESRRPNIHLNLNGAANTAQWIEKRLARINRN